MIIILFLAKYNKFLMKILKYYKTQLFDLYDM